ncbi:hypothetical protein IF2G_08474 [Cordyceps javanica]|nr:hypothetical protein IF2G_08474 [Cordyceps javanica]
MPLFRAIFSPYTALVDTLSCITCKHSRGLRRWNSISSFAGSKPLHLLQTRSDYTIRGTSTEHMSSHMRQNKVYSLHKLQPSCQAVNLVWHVGCTPVTAKALSISSLLPKRFPPRQSLVRHRQHVKGKPGTNVAAIASPAALDAEDLHNNVPLVASIAKVNPSHAQDSLGLKGKDLESILITTVALGTSFCPSWLSQLLPQPDSVATKMPGIGQQKTPCHEVTCSKTGWPQY